jgi:hypothetical protein
MTTTITGDLYDITNRIREVDESYYIVRNYCKLRWEVHSRAQKGHPLCFVVPYQRLDARTLELARRTRVERVQTLIAEMDAANALMQKRENGIIVDKAKGELDELLDKMV